ncbi:MAG: hypothetical protein BroJett010_02560 [Gammaproteobacteria bacterium]|nr:MAG: hypothetical protein BroJett010_02560 [Gammaproteobacteria bacterium]
MTVSAWDAIAVTSSRPPNSHSFNMDFFAVPGIPMFSAISYAINELDRNGRQRAYMRGSGAGMPNR